MPGDQAGSEHAHRDQEHRPGSDQQREGGRAGRQRHRPCVGTVAEGVQRENDEECREHEPEPGNVAQEAENTYVPFTVPASVLRAGDNVIAVEVHQDDATSSDASMDLRLAAG